VLVILTCAALVALGAALVVSERESDAARWPIGVRYAVLVVVPGVLAAGAGGRLVMRLLAVTSPDADGQITEAAATIGEITVEGTLGFIIFTGLPAGFLAAVLYLLVGAVLPRGRAGGAVLGLLLLVLVGAWLEPLRPDNFDFNLVGPDWLSVVSFTLLAAFQGMVTWGLAARLCVPALERVRPVFVLAAALVALPVFVIALADILT
jgi:hypothetical protein